MTIGQRGLGRPPFHLFTWHRLGDLRVSTWQWDAPSARAAAMYACDLLKVGKIEAFEIRTGKRSSTR